MKLCIATFIASGLLVCTAQASQNLDKYRKCWANASSAVINTNGVSGKTLSYAIFTADTQCQPLRADAIASNGVAVVNQITEWMVVQLHNANQVGDSVSLNIPPVEIATEANPPHQSE
ncbi:hypothetical protein CU102_15275 [Phyllobacterium brassicacearum]|uniref:Uncharacterized protein n=1 Tax=Phyllobacterium brassicacearum TaxID=314235 RepID=A0A2P7BN87_9HYPH|nr:hypothetical protein [Phyllobacterium brassicacearum]PSH67931.1 hypothetical protein CU102_15275 [Phyllobacterium brassicacearum]TDQ28176.1 hypothetical protein DEV91_11016 [Phyllobacterium brassicacearum]